MTLTSLVDQIALKCYKIEIRVDCLADVLGLCHRLLSVVEVDPFPAFVALSQRVTLSIYTFFHLLIFSQFAGSTVYTAF